jgi:hypothetical protein
MKTSEQILGPLKYLFESFSAKLARHVSVPDAHNDEDIFYAHLLEEMQQFLAGALLSTIIKTFYQTICVFFIFFRLKGTMRLNSIL